MASAKKPTNPFYLLLIAAGVAFAITACAFGVMTVRGMSPGEVEVISPSGQGLMEFLDQYGVWVMTAELIVLGIASAAAIGTDEYWTRRAKAAEKDADATPTTQDALE